MSISKAGTMVLLTGILMALLVIAIRLEPAPTIHFPESPGFPHELEVRESEHRSVVSLGENRFAIVHQDPSSYTKIIVLEYDEQTKNSFA